jgi:hypothetical protein
MTERTRQCALYTVNKIRKHFLAPQAGCSKGRKPLKKPPPGLKPSLYGPERFRGLESPLPRTKVRGWHLFAPSELKRLRKN